MSTYVYTCTDHPDIREEVIHSMNDDPIVRCPKCGEQMHRKPQGFMFYMDPRITLYDEMDSKYRAYRVRKQKEKTRK
jgi:putative FmdB family regulatory protein